MQILWEQNNIAHLARHKITPELAERIINAGASSAIPTDTNNRYIIEVELDGEYYRLICDIAAGFTVYPVTAFKIRKPRKYQP